MNIKHNLVKAALFVTCIIPVTAAHAYSDTTRTDTTKKHAIAAGAEHRSEPLEGPKKESDDVGYLGIGIDE